MRLKSTYWIEKIKQQGQMLEGKIAKPLLNFIIARYFSKGRDAQQP